MSCEEWTFNQTNNEPIILKIKCKCLMEEQKFHSVSVKVVEEIIKNIPSIKSSEGGIPIKILK